MAKNDDYRVRVDELRAEIGEYDNSANELLSDLRKSVKDTLDVADAKKSIAAIIETWRMASKVRADLKALREEHFKKNPEHRIQLQEMEAERQQLERDAMALVRDAEEPEMSKASEKATKMLLKALEIHHKASNLRKENRKPREVVRTGPSKLESQLRELRSYMDSKGYLNMTLDEAAKVIPATKNLKHAIIKGTTDSAILKARVERHAQEAGKVGLKLGYLGDKKGVWVANTDPSTGASPTATKSKKSKEKKGIYFQTPEAKEEAKETTFADLVATPVVEVAQGEVTVEEAVQVVAKKRVRKSSKKVTE